MAKNFIFSGLLLLCLSTKAQTFNIQSSFPDYSYDEIADRMNCIRSEIPLEFNQRVKDFIDYFAIKNRDYIDEVVKKRMLFFPIFEETLKNYDLPDELKYLSIVESGLKETAVSRAGAVGLWQFISSTGKIYGLTGDWYVDERLDPYESTDAAARHLRDLYGMFRSWELALAAYNCGAGNVRRAIRRSGYKKNFWNIYRYLPRETRSYVPQFVAITYIFNNLEVLGFDDAQEQFYPEFDTILISRYFHLETFCNQLGLCVDDMLLYNPQIKRGALPEGTKNFALRIPAELKDSVVNNRVALYDTASKVGKKHLEYLAKNTPGSTYGREKTIYRVRSGDVLGIIARRYHVRVSDLKSWNNLRGNLIRVGQRLNIWVLPTYSSWTQNLYTASNKRPKMQPKNPGRKKEAPLLGGGVYIVRSGDSLWSISKDNNTTIEKLKATNKLSSSKIIAGQSLVIPN